MDGLNGSSAWLFQQSPPRLGEVFTECTRFTEKGKRHMLALARHPPPDRRPRSGHYAIGQARYGDVKLEA